MINILNHNTTYKHSKFSARPGYAMPQRYTMRISNKLYFDNLLLKHRLRLKKKRNGKSSKNHTSQMNPHSFQEIFAPYRSKELLCWRFDLTFSNLQGFFLNMLKALHTCWTFAKNNKTIVFVSTDNPVDTGISESIDILTQKFPRDCLPRIQTRHNKHFRDVSSNDRDYYASRTALQKITKKENAYDRSSILHDPLWKRKNQHKTRKLSHNRVQVRNSNKTPGKIGRRHGSEILSELKKLTSALEFKKHPKTEDVSDLEHSYLTDWAYHKCDGLLYKAASRRLTASFSHMPASFFSNPKKSFQEKFGHVNSSFFENMKHEKKNETVKMLWPLNLNKSCFAKPGAAVQSKTQEQRWSPWIRTFRSNESDKIQQFLKPSPLGLQKQSDIMHTKKAQYDISNKMHHQRFSEKLFQDSQWRSSDVRPLIGSEEKKLVDSQKKGKDASLRKPNLATMTPFMDKWKMKSSLNMALGNILDIGTISLQDNKYKNKPHQNKGKPHQNKGKPHQNKPYGFRQLSHKRVKSYKSYDFYQKLVHIQNDDATKRYACNPYLQHADLVFFTNADKDNGLASQITKLGIPSIGIVSGLKKSSYRKLPHQRNLHDSVTFPIVGNPENIPFVTMIVRVFVTLVQKTYNRRLVHRAPASSVFKSLVLTPKNERSSNSATLSIKTQKKVDQKHSVESNQKQPAKINKEQPVKINKEQPVGSNKKQPAKINKEQPVKINKKQPAKINQKQPVKSNKKQPVGSNKELPVKINKKQPVGSNKEHLVESNKKHSVKINKKQPIKSNIKQPVKNNKEQPAKINKEQPAKINKKHSVESNKKKPVKSNIKQPVKNNRSSNGLAVKNKGSKEKMIMQVYSEKNLENRRQGLQHNDALTRKKTDALARKKTYR